MGWSGKEQENGYNIFLETEIHVKEWNEFRWEKCFMCGKN